MEANDTFTLEVTSIDKVCAVGEVYGRQCLKEGKIPVFSCEGGCIREKLPGKQQILLPNKMATPGPATENCSPFPRQIWPNGFGRRTKLSS